MGKPWSSMLFWAEMYLIFCMRLAELDDPIVWLNIFVTGTILFKIVVPKIQQNAMIEHDNGNEDHVGRNRCYTIIKWIFLAAISHLLIVNVNKIIYINDEIKSAVLEMVAKSPYKYVITGIVVATYFYNLYYGVYYILYCTFYPCTRRRRN